MNSKTVIAAVLMAGALTGIFSATALVAYADESETNTEQKIKQKNEGDGTLTNCAQNVLRAGAEQNCFPED